MGVTLGFWLLLFVIGDLAAGDVRERGDPSGGYWGTSWRYLTPLIALVLGLATTFIVLSRVFARRVMEDVRASLDVVASSAVLRRLWRNPRTLSALLSEVASVADRGDGRQRWTVVTRNHVDPARWDVELVEADDGRRLAWRGVDDEAGVVECVVGFEPVPTGTRVVLRVAFERARFPTVAITPAMLERVLARAQSLASTETGLLAGARS